MRVVLTGFMGTGKTAVGQRVAERLGRRFLDTDALVEKLAGRTVREIFAEDGEARFRALERRAVAEAAQAGEVVISTGGGALLDDRNFTLLSDGGLLICLTADARAIARRVRATAADRPMLGRRAGLTARIRELLAQRAPAYARIELAIDTTARTIDQVADVVIAALADAERAPARRRRRSGEAADGERRPRAGTAAAR